MTKAKIIATGDSFMTRRLPQNGYPGFKELTEVINSYDVKFNNIEFTAHDQEGYPAAVSGGTWAMSDPAVLDDLKKFGFNIYNTANNHSNDYSHGGILATINNLKKRDMLFAGTGKNLADANSPTYVETEHARVGLVACSASYDECAIAGNQTHELTGRPGLNPLRKKYTYYLEKKYYDTLKEVAQVSDINSFIDFEIRNGYMLPFPEGQLYFGGHYFVLSDKNETITTPSQKDMERIIGSVKEIKRQGDIALVSIHFHDFIKDTNIPPLYLREFARKCIDAGADAILGHGPHEIHGIEIYNGKPIFYSLGNFIFQTETVEYQPADAYENANMPIGTTIGEYMNQRNQNRTKGYIVQENIWRSIMAGFEIENGEVKEIKIYPITMNMGAPLSKLGIPSLANNNEVLKYLAELSEPFGTELEIYDDYALIKL